MLSFEKLISHVSKFAGVDWLTILRQVDEDSVVMIQEAVRCFIDHGTTAAGRAAMSSSDRPDFTTALANPIDTVLRIYTFPWVDIQKSDFFILRKTDQNGRLLCSWQGTCGAPFIYQPFQLVFLHMVALGSADNIVN